MENCSEIGEYVSALNRADVELRLPDGERLSFNGFENPVLYLHELLVPELYLTRLIRAIFKDPELFANEEQLMNYMDQLNTVFFVHTDTCQMIQKGLKIMCKGKPMEFTELAPGARELIAGFITEQYNSYHRVKKVIEQCQNKRKRK